MKEGAFAVFSMAITFTVDRPANVGADDTQFQKPVFQFTTA